MFSEIGISIYYAPFKYIMYCGPQMREFVPFTCLWKNTNKELIKIYEFFLMSNFPR